MSPAPVIQETLQALNVGFVRSCAGEPAGETKEPDAATRRGMQCSQRLRRGLLLPQAGNLKWRMDDVGEHKYGAGD